MNIGTSAGVTPVMKTMTAALSLAFGLIAPLALADHRDDGIGFGGPRVTLYEKADFRGGSITLHPGESIDNLSYENFDNGRGANDRISSIRIEGGAELYVWPDSRFRGETLRVTRDIRNLADLGFPGTFRNWNDIISSVRVEMRRGPRSGRGADPDIVIRRAYQDILLREPDETGLRAFRIRIIDQGWDEPMVRDALRRSEEYRGPVLDKVIGRAYRDLLGRDPDPSGLAHYRHQILNRGMSEEELREDIRRSAEYRNRPHSTVPQDGHGNAPRKQPR